MNTDRYLSLCPTCRDSYGMAVARALDADNATSHPAALSDRLWVWSSNCANGQHS